MITWQNVEIVIPTLVSNPFRLSNCRKLLLSIGQECPGATVKFLPQYKNNSYRDVFICISNGLLSTNRNWVLYLEDDIKLIDFFGNRLINKANEINQDIISFFSVGNEDLIKYNSGIFSYMKSGVGFGYLQCVLMKKEIAVGWANMMVDWWDNSLHKGAPDFSLGDYCASKDIMITISLPSLVQHIGEESILGHDLCPKSKTFGLPDI